MAEEPVYNLLQAIDPSKIKVPISEKFSKLTLSSNKKKRQQEAALLQDDQRQKRDSASRNLLDQLSQTQPSADDSLSSPVQQTTNPLLCSDSSKDQSHHRQKSHLGEYFETTMDSLNVTEDASDLSSEMVPLDLDLLTQKVSALSVVCHQPNSSMSSTSADPLNEVTQLVSTESQRSSIGEIKKFHNIKEVPVEILRREIIAVSSSSSSAGQNEQAYEITDDEEVNEKNDTPQTEEEEEEDTEDDVITISDSSVSVTAPDQTEMAISTVETFQDVGEKTVQKFREHLQLPLPTLSPEKMERVAAFLRDVSMEQKHRAEIGFTETEDSICNQSLPADRLTTADTESITPEDDDKKVAPKAISECENGLKALQEQMVVGQEENTKTRTAKQLAEAVTQDNSIVNDSKNHEKTLQNRERRLESADTVENTISDVELDSSLSLQVTPTPRKPADGGKKFIYDDTFETTQLSRMTGLQLQSQTPQKVTQPAKRCDDKNVIVQSNIEAKKAVRRLASAETVPNTIIPELSLTDHETLQPSHSSSVNLASIRRFASCETEENTLVASKHPNTPTSAKRGERRLVSADTEDVTTSDLQSSNSKTSQCDDNERRLALDDTEANTHFELSLTPEKIHSDDVVLSVPASPEYKTPLKSYLSGSVHSIVSSSDEQQCNENVPQHSITILETDEEECTPSHSSLNKSPQSNDNNKLSSSLHGNEHNDDSDSSSMSQLQMSMANINISAKIKIKITIPDCADTSEDDEESCGSSSQQNRNTNSLPENRQSQETISHGEELNVPEINGRTNQEIAHHKTKVKEKNDGHFDIEEIISDSDKSNYEDERFVDTAAKLLTQLYGNSWKTPEVLRNLVKSKESDDNKNIQTTSKVTKRRAKDSVPKAGTSKAVEESVLGDFSIFRRNICKTNTLDSTRLCTPNAKSSNTCALGAKECRTEPRNIRKGPEKDLLFAIPKAKSHRKPVKTPIAKISAKQIRSQNERWRQLVDNGSDSECNNASDDDDADESDASWKGNSSPESSDSDFEISGNKPNKTKIVRKKNYKTRIHNESQKRDNSNNEDLVYLDLSKEEVEVQEEVPLSPPANHDATFASKLEEILKTCRHEDKPKLPSSAQKTKSKRKLFTPMFGQDFEDDLPVAPEIERKENRQIYLNTNAEDGLIIDEAKSPFDASGKLKKLELFNKPLEAVKGGISVFQITTSAKKFATPTRRALQENNNETTPTSYATSKELRTKTPAKKEAVEAASGAISKTPDYKYSFLKSLDVTVSNTFCHPDARVYRDSYRTKKEDLSRILYNLYNDRLFKNRLEVQITWNKKLLNTAGRCLNKKKLGVRTSVIELSEKVLTSADRLRCTLIHELCHAATWIFSGEGGHGKTWKEWAHRANATFPELPKIGVCHQYEIEYKYTYKCTLCAARSHAHSKSKKVENIRCSYCHGAIEIFLNKKDKQGNIMPTPVREATGFAKFVKDNYKKFKRDELKHADVMKLLSNEFASMKVTQ